MLAGFHAMDEHFRTAPLKKTCPLLMGLLTVWYNNFFGAQTIGVMPYAGSLARFPAYLQQLQMESNGKHVDLEAPARKLSNRPDHLGRARDRRPAFLLPAYSPGHEADPLRPDRLLQAAQPADSHHHDLLMANMFAQAEALAFGKTAEELTAEGSPDCQTPFRVAEGDRPTNVILADTLTPRTLGALVALYEHNVFTQGAVWNIDSFDQWGVELGKVLAVRIIPELKAEGEPELKHDSSTNALIRRYRRALARPG